MESRITQFIIICLLFWSPCLIAEVPHEFKNGEVADANDINENFSFLSKRLELIREDESSSATNDIHDYTRNEVQVNPGHTFKVSGESYVVVGYPIVDVGTKERVLLLLPVAICDQSDSPITCNSSKPSQSVRVSHSKNHNIDKDFEINGYPVSIGITETRTYKNHLERDSTSSEYVAKWTVLERQYLSVSLFINESWVSFDLDLPSYQSDVQNKTISGFKSNYQSEIDWPEVEKHLIDVEAIAQIIDRINVQKI